MISRLLLTTAIGLALGIGAMSTAAFAQSVAATDNNTPATVALSEGVSVTEQDRARIGESVARMNVKSLRGVDFSVSAGANVPRELRVHRLPTEVGQIVPQYRDYRFLIVEKAIVIVEPKTNKIVTVLKPDNASTATATNAPPAAPTPAVPAKSVPAPVAETPARTAPVAAAPVAVAPVTTAPVAATPAPAASAPTVTTPTATAAEAPSTSTAATPPATAEQPAPPTRESAAEPERPKAKKQAARSQRRTVSRAERDEWRRSSAEVRVGQRVPDDVVLYRVPRQYYQEVPVTREYRTRGYAGSWRGRPIYQEFD